jgi:hypothetical protein
VYKDPLKFNEFEFKNLINYFSASTRGLLEQVLFISHFVVFMVLILVRNYGTAAGHRHFYQ